MLEIYLLLLCQHAVCSSNNIHLSLYLVFVSCSRESLSALNLRHCAGWLEDAAYFAAADDAMNTSSWYEWPEALKNRHVAALEEIYQSKKEFVRSLDPFASFGLASSLI